MRLSEPGPLRLLGPLIVFEISSWLSFLQMFCLACDPNLSHPILKQRSCNTCLSDLRYHCATKQATGIYKNFARHARTCSTCKPLSNDGKVVKKRFQEEKRQVERVHIQTQEPYCSWKDDPERLNYETGITAATFDLLLRSTSKRLKSVHGEHNQHNGVLLLSEPNLLLLYLVFLRKIPTAQELHYLFGVSKGHIFDLVRSVSAIVAPILEQYLGPPARMDRIVPDGHLQGAAFVVDSSHTTVTRPETNEERKRFYFWKKGGSFAVKWQVSVGLDGRIWEHGQTVYPGSVSDKKIFEESMLVQLAAERGIKGVGDSHYVKIENMYGTKKGKK